MFEEIVLETLGLEPYRWLQSRPCYRCGAFLLLLFTGQIGGFGTHYPTTRMADIFVACALAVLVISLASKVAKGKLALATLLMLELWLGSEMVA
jgi:hypothetical protein